VRCLFWAAVLPGTVAGWVPWRFFGLGRVTLDPGRPNVVAGLAVAAAGVALLAACVWEFAREGRGTPAPVDPPQVLVARGLYRYVRNPMYLSVSAILLGEALAAASAPLLGYWAAFFALVNGFVMGYEEPALRRKFGVSYERYTRQAGRWLPRLRTRPAGPSA
jgi:protein-S-isoprenylcysteine O-methyltransferase Ste14